MFVVHIGVVALVILRRSELQHLLFIMSNSIKGSKAATTNVGSTLIGMEIACANIERLVGVMAREHLDQDVGDHLLGLGPLDAGLGECLTKDGCVQRGAFVAEHDALVRGSKMDLQSVTTAFGMQWLSIPARGLSLGQGVHGVVAAVCLGAQGSPGNAVGRTAFAMPSSRCRTSKSGRTIRPSETSKKCPRCDRCFGMLSHALSMIQGMALYFPSKLLG